MNNTFFLWQYRLRDLPVILSFILLGVFNSIELQLWPYFIILYTFGALLRIWSRMYIGAHTRTRELHSHSLIYWGPYSISRNPLYLSNLLILFAFFILNTHIVLNIILSFILSIHYLRVALTEAMALCKQFPLEYNAWAQKTPFFIGKFQYKTGPKERSFINAFISDFWTWIFHILAVLFFSFQCQIFHLFL